MKGKLEKRIGAVLDNALQEGLNSLHINEIDKIIDEAREEFAGATSLRDYIVLVNKWFGSEIVELPSPERDEP